MHTTRMQNPTCYQNRVATGNSDSDFCNANCDQSRMNLENQRHGFFSQGVHLCDLCGKTSKIMQFRWYFSKIFKIGLYATKLAPLD